MESPNQLSYNGHRLGQPSAGLRWRQVVMRDRMNAAGELSFSVTRSHKTIQKAEQFTVTHELSLPNLDTLTLFCDDGSGTNIVKVTMANTFLETIKITMDGMLTVTAYVFKGGRLVGPTLT